MFEWDAKKAAANLAKHHVPFEYAAKVFDDPHRLESDVSRTQDGEARSKTVGRIGSKLFAVPWSALTMDAAEKRFILDVPKERLENAPGFDKDHWPSMADPTWATELHTYYNVRPYWEDVLPEDRDPRATGRGSTY